MEMFDVKQKEIDQVKKKEELKSTNLLKINKRKRKQKDIEKERDVMRKEKENDNLKEKIDERLKSIERSMMYTQNNSLAKLTKKIKKKI